MKLYLLAAIILLVLGGALAARAGSDETINVTFTCNAPNNTIRIGQTVTFTAVFSGPTFDNLEVDIALFGWQLVPGSGSSPAEMIGPDAWNFTNTGSATVSIAAVVTDVSSGPGAGAIGFDNAPDGRRGSGEASLLLTVDNSDFHVGIQPTVPQSGTVMPGQKLHYVVTGNTTSQVTGITLTDTLPNNSTLIPSSVKPAAKKNGTTLTWTFKGTQNAQAAFDVQINPSAKIPSSVTNITDQLQGSATLTAGGTAPDQATNNVPLSDGTVSVQFIDANPFYLPGIVLPSTGAAAALAARNWTSSYSRTVSRIAAEGVSLLLLRTKVDAPEAKSVQFTLPVNFQNLPVGGLWAVDDLSVEDTSSAGGQRDNTGDGSATVTANVVTAGGDTYAYALYRSPRNFDGLTPAVTGSLNSRTVSLQATALDDKGNALRAEDDETVTVVRPLVIFQHGTFDSPRGWANFPLWKMSGNEFSQFQIPPGGFPFQVDRTSFESVNSSAGHALPSARVVLQDIEWRLKGWTQDTGTAAAQVDVVTHSYGGVLLRLIAQGAVSTVPAQPLTVEETNFRSARNWGNGLVHKLITIAATHRGSSTGNHLSFLNDQGLVPGLVRDLALKAGAPIDQGAVEDQMVLSPLIQSLQETVLPCHAIIGCGLVQYNSFYQERFAKLWSADRPGGPYRSAGQLYSAFDGSPNFDNFLKLSNYTFNLDYSILSDDTAQNPNYDLTVSSYSMKARMPRTAYSDHSDLETLAGAAAGSLVGPLTHGDEISIGPTGNTVPSNAVAMEVLNLLMLATTDPAFAHIPATMAAPPTPLENSFSNHANFNPGWLYEKSIYSSSAQQAVAAAAVQPTLSAPGVGPEITAGQQIPVQIVWPGETLESGFAVWSGGVAGEEPFLLLTAGQTGFNVPVSPSQQPGAFTIMAFLTATDGSQAEASLAYDDEDAGGYAALAITPTSLVLSSLNAVPLSVYGELPGGGWQYLANSSLLSLGSSDDSVISISATGQLQPVGLGTATITASVTGSGSVTMPVTVSGDQVPVELFPVSKNPVVRLKSTTPVNLVFLSIPQFDPGNIDPTTIRINGIKPESVTMTDVNHDGQPDVVAAIAPKELGLTAGPQALTLVAATTGGTLVTGTINVTAK